MFFGLKYLEDHPAYRIHDALEAFLRNAVSAEAFSEELFPEWFRPIVDRSDRLRHKFEETFDSLQNISEADRESVLRVFLSSNEIERLCEDKSYPTEPLTGNLDEIAERLRGVCEHLYDHTLQSAAFKDEGIENAMKDHYIEFRTLNALVCPFCGIENYPDKESGMRASYDHYMNRARYPLSGVNFRNLVPMCRSCNEPPNKGRKDILNEEGRRRQAFYPYGASSGVRLSVLCTKTPEIDDNEGKWAIEITPIEAIEGEKVETWKEVFSIVKRLQARIKEKHNSWVRDFLAIQYGGNTECNAENLRSAFKNRAESLADPHFAKSENESVVKQAFFEFLAQKAKDAILKGYTYHCTSPYMQATASRGEFLQN